VKKWRRILKWLGLGLALAAAIGVFGFYRASQYVPEFYVKSLQIEPARQQVAADRMVKQATTLASNVQRVGRWQVTFTAEQVNAWLAVELPKEPAYALPPSLSDPRVEITPAGMTIACRYQEGDRRVVLSLATDVYLVEKNVVALRIRRARAGMLPLPLNRVLRELARSFNHLEWRVEWRQADGDPVAQITIPSTIRHRDRQLEVDAVRLGEGELTLGGATRPRTKKAE
jgi:hypothetical protein